MAGVDFESVLEISTFLIVLFYMGALCKQACAVARAVFFFRS